MGLDAYSKIVFFSSPPKSPQLACPAAQPRSSSAAAPCYIVPNVDKADIPRLLVQGAGQQARPNAVTCVCALVCSKAQLQTAALTPRSRVLAAVWI